VPDLYGFSLPAVPSESDSDIFGQDILEHLSFALCLRARKGILQSLELSCLVPATPGHEMGLESS
jgi:hypothetical protein